MAFKLVTPPSHHFAREDAGPIVRLQVNASSGKKLSINAPALRASGLKGKDELVFLQDDETPTLFQIRRREEGEPTMGILSQAKAEKNGFFSFGGKFVYDQLERDPGAVEATCGDGWIVFNAAGFPARDPNAPPIQPKPSKAKVTPPTPPPSKPTDGTAPPAPPVAAPRPEPPKSEAPKTEPPKTEPKSSSGNGLPASLLWSLQITPRVTRIVVEKLVSQAPVSVISRELSLPESAIAAVGNLVPQTRIEALRQMDYVERSEWLDRAEEKWQERYDRTPEEKRP